MNSLLLLSGGLLYLSMVLVLQLVIGCWQSKVSVISEFIKEFCENSKLCFVVALSLALNLFVLHMKFQTELFWIDVMMYLSVIISMSFISVGVLWMMPYDDVDYALSQNCKCSIGACWANGAVMAYYEESLNKFRARVEKFEDDHPNVKLLVKKLVLIAPLSCNIEGSLSDRDESKIRHIGDLEPIERDEGANINRKLITPVYEIGYPNMGIFIAAEYPSPLGTLWGERYGMDEDAKIYIRDCFLKELKDQLKSKPVIILEYDDQNPSDTVPLNEFIVSSLPKPAEENNFTEICYVKNHKTI